MSSTGFQVSADISLDGGIFEFRGCASIQKGFLGYGITRGVTGISHSFEIFSVLWAATFLSLLSNLTRCNEQLV
jgi:hypothetical protein